MPFATLIDSGDGNLLSSLCCDCANWRVGGGFAIVFGLLRPPFSQLKEKCIILLESNIPVCYISPGMVNLD